MPGAQRPESSMPGAADRPGAAASAPRSSAADVYSFLSNFQDGVSRGRAEARGGAEGDDPTEDRPVRWDDHDDQ
ncbi:MAG: hypothetical protein AB7L84_09655 [Acidimicrobiia bacterium]